MLKSNSKSRIAESLSPEHKDEGARSTTRKRIRVWLISLALICVWLTVRFPYQAESGLAYLFNGPNQINPQTLHLHGEFVESNLGPVEEADGVIVRMIAEQYLFVPHCVVVPTGVPIRFRMTSADVVHMLTISGTGDEVKVVPGYIVETRAQFDRPGEHQMPCHEFCGPGHYTMRSHLIVVPLEQFRKLSLKERTSCASR